MSEKVQVLMSTYNGTRFLPEQLSSVYSQEGVSVALLVRDDSSTDGTCALLEKEKAAGRLEWYNGGNLGPALSFWDTLHKAPDADYYAFCDQDDVWDSDKLKVAVEQLRASEGTPALYFCQTRLVDEALVEIPSVRIDPLLTYGESLVYHFVTGCTMVFNDAMRRELLCYTPSYMRMHDIWIYSVAQAVGAKIYFDSTPHMSYRQHGSNVVGLKNSKRFVWRNRFERIKRNEHIRSIMAQELLRGYGSKMQPEHKALTMLAANYRSSLSSWMKLLFSKKTKCAPLSINITSKIAILLRIF